ncbi:MAG TPA: RNA polymerase sigma factor FliA [Gammaproteobacteria bacterium]|nr:RNA polymerase sigma factor FliA [Gammaproteobacteria bacterium]
MTTITNGWAMYTDEETKVAHELVKNHAGLVKRIAHHLKGRLPPSVQIEDLIQAGMIGLLEASKNYDDTKGASFETYSGIRIRGSMLDEIRKGDWAPRSVHRNTRKITHAIRKIENLVGRDAKDYEVAQELEVSLEDYHKMLQDSVGTRIFGFDDVGVTEDLIPEGIAGYFPSPLDGLQKADFHKALAKGISGLPERERLVLALYYDEELNLREVGEVLGVSESRVSQIHSQAMLRLQARMKDWETE